MNEYLELVASLLPPRRGRGYGCGPHSDGWVVRKPWLRDGWCGHLHRTYRAARRCQEGRASHRNRNGRGGQVLRALAFLYNLEGRPVPVFGMPAVPSSAAIAAFTAEEEREERERTALMRGIALDLGVLLERRREGRDQRLDEREKLARRLGKNKYWLDV